MAKKTKNKKTFKTNLDLRLCIINFLWILTEDQWIGFVLFSWKMYLRFHLVALFLDVSQVTFSITLIAFSLR